MVSLVAGRTLPMTYLDTINQKWITCKGQPFGWSHKTYNIYWCYWPKTKSSAKDGLLTVRTTFPMNNYKFASKTDSLQRSPIRSDRTKKNEYVQVGSIYIFLNNMFCFFFGFFFSHLDTLTPQWPLLLQWSHKLPSILFKLQVEILLLLY